MGEEKYVFPPHGVNYQEAYSRLVALVQNCESILRRRCPDEPEVRALTSAVNSISLASRDYRETEAL